MERVERTRAAELQRERRKAIRRIDYMPGEAALKVIQGHQGGQAPGSVSATNSAVIDAIVLEWAELTGRAVSQPKSLEPRPGITSGIARARAGAYESGGANPLPAWSGEYLARRASRKATARVICGAKRHRDGKPCQAKSEPGKKRCRFHGGRSTGPRTPEGKARCAANLPNRKRASDA